MKKQLTAAIYDRWLFTLGGGEQVAFAYAQVLRDLGYQTTLLSHQKIDVDKAQQKMNVDLQNIAIKYLPPLPSSELPKFFESYDLFINTSYLDYFPNRSKNGILSVFFPGQIFLTPWEYLKRVLFIPSLNNFFIYPSSYENFANDEYFKGKIYKWLKPCSWINFKHNVNSIRITLYLPIFSFAVLDEIKFALNETNLVPTSRVFNHHSNTISYQFKFPQNTKNKKFSIILPAHEYAKEIALVRLTIPGLRYFLYNLFKKFFPVWEMRLHGGPGVTKRADLESYQKIITISKFCQKWIKKYWGLPSFILYPPVNTKEFASNCPKKKWITHIGRFFVTGHNKKQLDLVKIFKKIYDKYEVKDWELHFIGSVHEGAAHQAYFEQVKFEAQGYPIFFHIDVPFAGLKNILCQSSIYWHATGLDGNENENPIVFEHFGVTTVEAMAAGVVPIVINAGGQKEIVTKISGFKWNNRQELLKYTLLLIKNPQILKKLSTNAQQRSQYFSRKNFQKRFKELIT